MPLAFLATGMSWLSGRRRRSRRVCCRPIPAPHVRNVPIGTSGQLSLCRRSSQEFRQALDHRIRLHRVQPGSSPARLADDARDQDRRHAGLPGTLQFVRPAVANEDSLIGTDTKSAQAEIVDLHLRLGAASPRRRRPAVSKSGSQR